MYIMITLPIKILYSFCINLEKRAVIKMYGKSIKILDIPKSIITLMFDMIFGLLCVRMFV